MSAPVMKDLPAPRRVCAVDQYALPVRGQGYLKVPFARCADGFTRHVTTVGDLSYGPFHCLGCDEALSLRRSRTRRTHFAHRPDSQCTGETALHRYAKELLELRKTLSLPVLILQDEGLTTIVFEPGIYDFEQVMPEHNLTSFQPDALVTYKGVELAIEFRVTHAVDAEKRAKVLARDLSMIEIDLSSIGAGQMSREALDHAILHAAPRQWIYHRHQAAAAKKLADRVSSERAARGKRLKFHIEKRVRSPYPEDWQDEATASAQQADLGQHLDVGVEGEHWFAVPRAIWQAHILDVLVIRPSQHFDPGRSIEIKGEWPNEKSLASKLPRWMIRTDLGDYPPKRLAAAGYDRTSYGTPDHAIWSFLAALEMTVHAVFWNREDQSFFVDPELHGRLHRRVALRRTVTNLLSAADHADPDGGYCRWAETFRTDGVTVARMIEYGGDGYRDLSQRLSLIEKMVPTYSRTVTDDLCGLPLEAIRVRTMAAIDADRAEKTRSVKAATDARRDSITEQAHQMLERDGPEWLGRHLQDEGLSIADYASASDEALYRAERWLAAAYEKRRQAISTAQRVTSWRAELTQAVHKAFPDFAKAELFLNSSHPRLGGRSPIDYCDSKPALDVLISCLPKRR